jgi:hypothetical protein
MLDLLDSVIEKIITTGWSTPPALPTLTFEIPDDNFAGRIDAPTLNIYLCELKENASMRRAQWDTIALPDRSTVLSQPPSYFDCHYLISAWSASARNEIAPPSAEEHALLGAALRVLLRSSDVIPSVIGVPGGGDVFQGSHLYFAVSAPDSPRVVNDFWSTMKMPWRPTISLIATAPVDPGVDSERAPLLTTFIQRYGAIGAASADFEELIQIGGWVLNAADDTPVAGAIVERLQTGEQCKTDSRGQYTFAGLRRGVQKFRASAPAKAPLEQDIDIPAGLADTHIFRLS